VDQLHFKAGSSNVVELHGTNAIVHCINTDCSYSVLRYTFQGSLTKINPSLAIKPQEDILRPDGDVNLTQEEVNAFELPKCPKCDQTSLKPKIVFFGDSVPRDKVDKCKRLVSESDAILVVGSSLQVYSGYRFLVQAKEEGKRIGIINIGTTRADHLADLKIGTRAGDILSKIQLD
jgi:NAD-dependent deacetylase sirtuin 4